MNENKCPYCHPYKDDGQVQTDNNKTSEKPSDEVSDQNKNVGTNNEQ